jgi:hypothetical protein
MDLINIMKMEFGKVPETTKGFCFSINVQVSKRLNTETEVNDDGDDEYDFNEGCGLWSFSSRLS